MNEAKAVLAILSGCVFIGLSYFGKQFYAARGVHGVAMSSRKVPRWQGRLLFLVIGIAMLLVGVKYLLFER